MFPLLPPLPSGWVGRDATLFSFAKRTPFFEKLYLLPRFLCLSACYLLLAGYLGTRDIWFLLSDRLLLTGLLGKAGIERRNG